MSGCAVVAVGGNALTTPDESGSNAEIAAHAAELAESLAVLVGDRPRLAVVHGNGPQVGNLLMQQDTARDLVPRQPLHQLCAMTQGQLGAVLVRALDRAVGRPVAVALVTHVVVDPDDPALQQPTKPVGPFFSESRARELARESGGQVAEDAGRGWRRVVPSPKPVGIVELSAVRVLLAAGHVVLSAGGGGVAVTEEGLVEVDAVIDKDDAAATLASALGAGELFLVTGVDHVELDFGTARARPAHELSIADAERHLAAGQFPAGSMGPKVSAALHFLRDGGQRAIITSSRQIVATAAGDRSVGTWIEPAPTRVGQGA